MINVCRMANHKDMCHEKEKEITKSMIALSMIVCNDHLYILDAILACFKLVK